MNNISNIESTEHTFLLDNNILGFSGVTENHDKNRSIKLIKVKKDNLDILVVFRRSDHSHHKSQDSVGLFMNKDNIRFGIADGVSIIRGTESNESEVLAKNLIMSLPTLDKNWEEKILNISRKFIDSKKIGASNFFWSDLTIENNSKLTSGYISSNEDFGLNKISIDNKIEDLRNESWGFLPNYYKTDHYFIDLPNKFSLVFSSDGVYIDNLNLNLFLKFLKENSNLSDIKEYLTNIIRESGDDQSLIIITKN